MIQVTIKVDGLNEIAKGLDEASRAVVDELQECVRQSGELIKQRSRRIAGSPPIVFRGELTRSIQNRVSRFHADIGAFGSATKYSDVVEFGRRPGKRPPTQALEDWARIKLGKSGLGFIIARKIGMKGTKAQPYMQPAFDQSESEIMHLLNRAVDNIVRMI